jgi:hypothetical protein
MHPATKKGSAMGALSNNKTISVIVVDDCLLAITVSVFLLDHRSAIRRLALALLDHGAVAIPITIVALAHGRSSTDWSNANADIVSEGGRSDCAYNRRSEQVLFHVSLSSRYNGKAIISLSCCSGRSREKYAYFTAGFGTKHGWLGILSARPSPLEDGEAAGSGWSPRRITTAAFQGTGV